MSTRPPRGRRQSDEPLGLASFRTDDSSLLNAAAALRAAPPWLVSLLVHVLALICLALCYLPIKVVDFLEIQVTTGQDRSTSLLDQPPAWPTLDITKPSITAPSSELLPNHDAVAEPVESLPIFNVRLQQLGPENHAPTTSSIRRALSGREVGAKRALLAAYGGTGETEHAVQLGLQWLRRNQRRDGTWSLAGPYTNGAPLENKAAATAMAMLAFLGAGNTHLTGEHRDRVSRGARALTKMQDTDGNFYQSTVDRHRLYSQAMATIAVCELYGMTQDDRFRQAAQRALDYAARIQASDDQAGGWRYIPGQDIDTSVTGWFAMALQSGKMAELEISEAALQKISIYLDHVTDDGIHYKYLPRQSASLTMTAEALLCRQYLGWNQNDSRLSAGVSYLLTNPIEWKSRGRNVYYWYYATQVLHHMGGDQWDHWNKDLKRVLPRHQQDGGRERGSWDPIGDEHGGPGGRLYTTCLSICMLEVYYRHLPIYAQR